MAGDGDVKGRSDHPVACGADLASVSLDNRPHQEQPQTHAVRFRGIEWFEQIRHLFSGDARPAVGDRNAVIAFRVHVGVNPDLTALERTGESAVYVKIA